MDTIRSLHDWLDINNHQSNTAGIRNRNQPMKNQMKIVVNGQYTYECDYKVKIGQQVVLPTTGWLRSVKGPTWIGEVTSLESTYDGYCDKVIKTIRLKKK